MKRKRLLQLGLILIVLALIGFAGTIELYW